MSRGLRPAALRYGRNLGAGQADVSIPGLAMYSLVCQCSEAQGQTCQCSEAWGQTCQCSDAQGQTRQCSEAWGQTCLCSEAQGQTPQCSEAQGQSSSASEVLGLCRSWKKEHSVSIYVRRAPPPPPPPPPPPLAAAAPTYFDIFLGTHGTEIFVIMLKHFSAYMLKCF